MRTLVRTKKSNYGRQHLAAANKWTLICTGSRRMRRSRRKNSLRRTPDDKFMLADTIIAAATQRCFSPFLCVCVLSANERKAYRTICALDRRPFTIFFLYPATHALFISFVGSTFRLMPLSDCDYSAVGEAMRTFINTSDTYAIRTNNVRSISAVYEVFLVGEKWRLRQTVKYLYDFVIYC